MKSWMLITLIASIIMFGILHNKKQQIKGVSLSSSSSSPKNTLSKNNNHVNYYCPHGEERTWHGGHPAQDHSGSCWCGQDEYCMCTPSVAIDIVLYQKRATTTATTKSADDEKKDVYDVYVVQRSDTNQLATIGGFVDTGETTEHAVLREVQEETGITIPAYLMSSHNSGGSSSSSSSSSKSNNSLSPLKLIGVYSDPRRDNRRHIVSIAYALEFMPDIMTTKDGSGIPKAGDDAKEVIAIPLEEIGVKYVGEDWYADHLSILLDWKMQLLLRDEKVDRSKELYGGDVARSTCS
jgi:ADP-ribose pyrophosphatase YjhB (NUDIX family)